MIDERLVGKRHRSAERVTDQFAAEIAKHILLAFCQQIISQAVHAVDFGAIFQTGGTIDRMAGDVGGAQAADGVVTFQGHAERIDALVADSTLGNPCVFLNHLANRQ